jgi:ChrB-like protein
VEGFRWLVLTWRLPTGLSTPRVTVWRRLRRLGAVALTPGAAIVPYSEPVVEQFDWLAEAITDEGGDAWVLPVGELPEADEARITKQSLADRADEYRQLEVMAGELSDRAQNPERARQALDRRLRKVIARDYFSPPERSSAVKAVARALSPKSRRAKAPRT